MFLCLALYLTPTSLVAHTEACGIVRDPAPYIAACEASPSTCEVIVTRTGTIRIERVSR